jgi:NTE family protein
MIEFNPVKLLNRPRQAADPRHREGTQWSKMQIHRTSSEAMVELGYTSKLNADWDFLAMLRDEGRRAANAFMDAYGKDLGRRSSFDRDSWLEGA